MIADLKERGSNTVTPFVIVNFSHHEHFHLPKDHIVAFKEKDCKEGEMLEIYTMEQLERELPRNWIPERKRQEKFSKFFENPFMQKDDDFLKSPAEAPVHRKVLLEDKTISPKTQEAFDKLCEKYNDIISKNSGDIGKTMLVEMEIDTGNHPPIASKPYTLPLKHYGWVQKEIETLELQGLSVLFACVGSGDPVRVLRLYTMNRLDIFEAFIAEAYVQLATTDSNVSCSSLTL